MVDQNRKRTNRPTEGNKGELIREAEEEDDDESHRKAGSTLKET
jgi:hypothetical protein